MFHVQGILCHVRPVQVDIFFKCYTLMQFNNKDSQMFWSAKPLTGIFTWTEILSQYLNNWTTLSVHSSLIG